LQLPLLRDDVVAQVMHSSQMETVGPAMSFRTSSRDFPQKEQYSFGSSGGVCRRERDIRERAQHSTTAARWVTRRAGSPAVQAFLDKRPPRFR